MTIGIRDASSGKCALMSSATGMEFRDKSFSKSMGDGAGPTEVSSRTGVTGNVLGKRRGTEYGFGRVKFSGIGWSAKIDSFCWGEVTRSSAAWMVCLLVSVRTSGQVRWSWAGCTFAAAVTAKVGVQGRHTPLWGAAKAPRVQLFDQGASSRI